MIAGAGANITVQVGEQLVFVVDSGVAPMSDQVLAAIRSVTDKHIMFIINTSADADHTGGNENLSKAGWALPNGLNPHRFKRLIAARRSFGHRAHQRTQQDERAERERTAVPAGILAHRYL